MKPVLHGRHSVAITGKPLGATAGATIFQKGGNAVDAACAMLGAVGHARLGRRNAGADLQPANEESRRHQRARRRADRRHTGVFRSRNMPYPPEFGPLAAVTPGTAGGLMTMLAELGTLSLKDVLAPAIEMAEGYAIEAQAADAIERQKADIKKWPSRRPCSCPTPGPGRRYAGSEPAPVLPQRRGVRDERAAGGRSPTRVFCAAVDSGWRQFVCLCPLMQLTDSQPLSYISA